jgi:hypothetical protein
MNIDDLRADLAALHMICRFNGRVKRHYSVAEHTAIGLEYMVRQEMPVHLQRAWAAHDLPESVMGLGDIARDQKRLPAVAAIAAPIERSYLQTFDEFLREQRGGSAFAGGFDVQSIFDPVVKAVDRMMAVAEVQAVALCPHDDPDDFEPYVHGFACRRILEGSQGREPLPRLEPWFVRLFGLAL